MDFKEVTDKRRAVNFFNTEREVSDELIKEMIEIAARAPSSFNLQPWSLIIIKDMEDKLRLREVAWDQPKISEAPVVFIVLADRNGWKEGHKFVERNFQEMVKAGSMVEDQHDWFINACTGLYGDTPEKQQAFACKNAGFFGVSLMYAAKHLGFDSHPMDGFALEGVRREFNIPDSYWVPFLLAIGHFNETKELVPPKWRKTFDEIVVKFE